MDCYPAEMIPFLLFAKNLSESNGMIDEHFKVIYNTIVAQKVDLLADLPFLT